MIILIHGKQKRGIGEYIKKITAYNRDHIKFDIYKLRLELASLIKHVHIKKILIKNY